MRAPDEAFALAAWYEQHLLCQRCTAARQSGSRSTMLTSSVIFLSRERRKLYWLFAYASILLIHVSIEVVLAYSIRPAG